MSSAVGGRVRVAEVRARVRARTLCVLSQSVLAAVLTASGCNTSQPLRMEAALRLDGPVTIQMQMQGPSARYTGTYVSDDLYKVIEVDKTTEEWLLAALGEPDRRVDLRDGGALLVWVYRIEAVEGSFVNVVDIGGKDEKHPSSMTTVLRMSEGVVREKWRG